MPWAAGWSTTRTTTAGELLRRSLGRTGQPVYSLCIWLARRCFLVRFIGSIVRCIRGVSIVSGKLLSFYGCGPSFIPGTRSDDG
jgi:hypothetical protein